MRDNKKLILIVDDEEDIREILAETLENLGFAYIKACDGDEAIARLDKYHAEIDAAICDLKMPKVSGDQVISHVARNYPLIPVIILTGFAQLDMALDHMRLGAFDYMTKPFRVKELLLLLNRALEFRALQEEKINYQTTLEKRIEEATQALHNRVVQTVSSFILAIEEKDRYTQGHSKRVAEYSTMMAEVLNLPENERLDLLYAAQLHDIGKIGISEQLLNKPGKLNKVEYETIKTHPSKGVKILEPLVFLAHLLPVIEAHHEWFDGSGYPKGLAGDRIPYMARIIAVCDSFDAMTSARSYRKPLPLKVAIQEIKDGSGSQFDPNAVNAFLEVFHDVLSPRMTAQGFA
ncbi:MAG: response regulator [Deltaproteobacteria bacterium]|nr:response regulator [Deltaproteobacteria bacterium]